MIHFHFYNQHNHYIKNYIMYHIKHIVLGLFEVYYTFINAIGLYSKNSEDVNYVPTIFVFSKNTYFYPLALQ